ncbi:LicD family protein [Chitinophaga sancti]|uniref:LicD family protein n=1 Tax=Chitinophaga sancti TaxID=1004 RepID=A0A1K1LV80_9BACT|nr:LicD family protein [Chitinophaga sancti]WQD64895.1 LicD family protein [Chitinophaga sancti]WQG89481.1 LicD family protein [Chitinophaga sancti]SFW13574.1 LicD family protein [Chitinophaga sancti]
MIIYRIPLANNQEISGPVQPAVTLQGAHPAITDIAHDAVRTPLKMDKIWHKGRYGFELPQSDTENFLLHYAAWELFAASGEDWCMIVEASVRLEADYADILERISALKDGWDVYFPFDRMKIREAERTYTTHHNNSLLNPNRKEIYDFLPFLLGYCWGSSIYFLSRQGVGKLLAIQEIKQRVDDEIVSMSYRKQLQACFDEVNWFDYNHQPKVVAADRNRDILHAIMDSKRWTADSKDQIRTILQWMSEAAKQIGVDLILQGGTHLGYIRHGGIMPWDDDVDLGIEEQHLEAFLAAIATHTPLRTKIHLEAATDSTFYKLWLDDGTPIDEHTHNFPFVDLWMYTRVGDDLVFRNGIVCPNSGKYPFQDVCFENAALKMTANSLEVLDSRYRTWRTGIRVYNYYHSREKNQGFALRVSISVDENGRMILP